MSEYKLTQEIIALSQAKTWDVAKLEWILHEIYEAEEPETCLCGHFPIIEICTLQNKLNSNFVTVGNCCVKKSGGITVLFIEAINGFKTKHGYWPTSIHYKDATIAALATYCLIPLGFFLLQSKIELRPGEQGKIIAYGKDNDAFDYGEEGWHYLCAK